MLIAVVVIIFVILALVWSLRAVLRGAGKLGEQVQAREDRKVAERRELTARLKRERLGDDATPAPVDESE